MALAKMLGDAGFTPDKIETHAAVTLDKAGEGFEITASHLKVSAKVPGADKLKFVTVDYGAAEPKRVITGAPNIAPGESGMKVILGPSISWVSRTIGRCHATPSGW